MQEQDIVLYDKNGAIVDTIYGSPTLLQVGDMIKISEKETVFVHRRIWNMTLPEDKRFELIVKF